MDNLLPSDWASRVYYGGLALAVIWRFVQKRTLMKWPDAILLGLILIALAAGAISAAPWTLKHFGGRNLAVSQANDSTEVATLKEDNAKLKVENSRLKKTKAPREVTVLPAPASESRTPISAKLSADDCDDLTRAQQLRDSAEENLIKAAPIQIGPAEGLYGPRMQFGAGESEEKYQAAMNTVNTAGQNLQRVEDRLCAERKPY